jgi:DNA repair exonuclease SbcCD ATPase subunit
MLESSDKYIKLCENLISDLALLIPTGHALYKEFDELRKDFKTINASSPDMVKLSCIHIKLWELKKKIIPISTNNLEVVYVESHKDCGDLEQQNANLLQIIDNLSRELDEFKNEVDEFKIIKSKDSATITELISAITELSEQTLELLTRNELLNTNKSEVEKNNHEISAKLATITKEKKELENRFDILKQENTDLNEKYDRLNTASLKALDINDKLFNENKSLIAKLKNSINDISTLNADVSNKLTYIKELEEKNNLNSNNQKKYIEDLNAIIKQNKDLNSVLSTEIAELINKSNNKDELTSKLLLKLELELEKNKNLVTALQAEVEELNKKNFRLDDENQSLKNKIIDLTNSNEKHMSYMKDTQSELSKMLEQHPEYIDTIRILNTRLFNLGNISKELNLKIETLTAENDRLRDIIKNHEVKDENNFQSMLGSDDNNNSFTELNKGLEEELESTQTFCDNLAAQIEQYKVEIKNLKNTIFTNNETHETEIMQLKKTIKELKTGNTNDTVNKLINRYERSINIDLLAVLQLYITYENQIFATLNREKKILTAMPGTIATNYIPRSVHNKTFRLSKDNNFNNFNILMNSITKIVEYTTENIINLLKKKSIAEKPSGIQNNQTDIDNMIDNFLNQLTIYLVNSTIGKPKASSQYIGDAMYDNIHADLKSELSVLKTDINKRLNFNGNKNVNPANNDKYFGGGVLGGCVMLLNNAVAVLMIMCVLLIMYIIYLYYTNYNKPQNNKPQNNYNPYDIMY